MKVTQTMEEINQLWQSVEIQMDVMLAMAATNGTGESRTLLARRELMKAIYKLVEGEREEATQEGYNQGRGQQ